VPGSNDSALTFTCCLQSPLGACSLRRISPRNATGSRICSSGACCRRRFPSGGGHIGKIQNIVVPAHEVAHSRGDCQIDVRLIFGIPVELKDARDCGNDYSSFFECHKESIDNLVCQCGKPLSNPGSCQHVANFGQDFSDTQNSIASNSTKRRHAPAALSRLAAP
jgi:hypothetical protein